MSSPTLAIYEAVGEDLLVVDIAYKGTSAHGRDYYSFLPIETIAESMLERTVRVVSGENKEPTSATTKFLNHRCTEPRENHSNALIHFSKQIDCVN